jgi:hypothetical protein
MAQNAGRTPATEEVPDVLKPVDSDLPLEITESEGADVEPKHARARAAALAEAAQAAEVPAPAVSRGAGDPPAEVSLVATAAGGSGGDAESCPVAENPSATEIPPASETRPPAVKPKGVKVHPDCATTARAAVLALPADGAAAKRTAADRAGPSRFGMIPSKHIPKEKLPGAAARAEEKARKAPKQYRKVTERLDELESDRNRLQTKLFRQQLLLEKLLGTPQAGDAEASRQANSAPPRGEPSGGVVRRTGASDGAGERD